MTDHRSYHPPRAVVFDLGGTLVDWPRWEEDAPRIWTQAYEHFAGLVQAERRPERESWVEAMREAELAHWQRVDTEHWSGPPSGLVHDGFRRLGVRAHEEELLAAMDGYGRAVDGWAEVFEDARGTLLELRQRGYRLGLLSNTWWAAEWHNADLAAHGLGEFLDELVYTSDLPHSKPHPEVFREVTERLGVEPAACVMVGDRLLDDIGGALSAGLRAIWRENDRPWPRPPGIAPHAAVQRLDEIPALLRGWGGA